MALFSRLKLLALAALLVAAWMPSATMAHTTTAPPAAVDGAADDGLTTVGDQLQRDEDVLGDEQVAEPLQSSGGLRGLKPQLCLADYSTRQCKWDSQCCSHNCVNGGCRAAGDLQRHGHECRDHTDCHSHYCMRTRPFDKHGICKERDHHDHPHEHPHEHDYHEEPHNEHHGDDNEHHGDDRHDNGHVEDPDDEFVDDHFYYYHYVTASVIVMVAAMAIVLVATIAIRASASTNGGLQARLLWVDKSIDANTDDTANDAVAMSEGPQV
ncbi:unnamed protein product [Vitrella brassicaformis CCMP3155]|uniref:WAP domain-containing protein n=2 Tax=Vitrella brassicaformis TaxID=1169539 RepID=A0A0G4FT33_VITBC|nr:unnamed protein product [Vitrella brassicaformis CCMP3155]|eukprot:CEM17781.1 unnamed protein product [Vitrella brassicaformis CCMP3155]